MSPLDVAITTRYCFNSSIVSWVNGVGGGAGIGRMVTLFNSMRSRAICLSSAGVVEILSTTSDRKSTRLNSSHLGISYAVFCLKKKKIRRTVVQSIYERFASYDDDGLRISYE